MSLKSAILALFEKEKEDAKTKISALEHGQFSSTRLLLVIAFIGLLIWVKTLLSDKNIELIFWVVITYIVTNTISKCVFAVCNTYLKIRLTEIYSKGDVTAEEEQKIDSKLLNG